MQISKLDFEEDGWETIIDFTEIREGGVPLTDVLEYLNKIEI